MTRPFAPACERNAQPILQQLQAALPERCKVLEIGSGTGQHAAYFLQTQAQWIWQCSDQATSLSGIDAWLSDLGRDDIPASIELDVTQDEHWPRQRFDSVFSSNTLHIMPWSAVLSLFDKLPSVLNKNASLLAYGPFKENGEFTTPSNQEFDHWLKARNPDQGLRDLEAIDALASKAGLQRTRRVEMPANNLFLQWQRQT